MAPINLFDFLGFETKILFNNHSTNESRIKSILLMINNKNKFNLK
jgi:hypothetical protein